MDTLNLYSNLNPMASKKTLHQSEVDYYREVNVDINYDSLSFDNIPKPKTRAHLDSIEIDDRIVIRIDSNDYGHDKFYYDRNNCVYNSHGELVGCWNGTKISFLI